MSDFEAQYQQCFPEPDHDFELAVAGWVAYHNAADRIDGHIRDYRQNPKLVGDAVRAGFRAMRETVGEHRVRWVKAQTGAKLEALRRIERATDSASGER